MKQEGLWILVVVGVKEIATVVDFDGGDWSLWSDCIFENLGRYGSLCDADLDGHPDHPGIYVFEGSMGVQRTYSFDGVEDDWCLEGTWRPATLPEIDDWVHGAPRHTKLQEAATAAALGVEVDYIDLM